MGSGLWVGGGLELGLGMGTRDDSQRQMGSGALRSGGRQRICDGWEGCDGNHGQRMCGGSDGQGVCGGNHGQGVCGGGHRNSGRRDSGRR